MLQPLSLQSRLDRAGKARRECRLAAPGPESFVGKISHDPRFIRARGRARLDRGARLGAGCARRAACRAGSRRRAGAVRRRRDLLRRVRPARHRRCLYRRDHLGRAAAPAARTARRDTPGAPRPAPGTLLSRRSGRCRPAAPRETARPGHPDAPPPPIDDYDGFSGRRLPDGLDDPYAEVPDGIYPEEPEVLREEPEIVAREPIERAPLAEPSRAGRSVSPAEAEEPAQHHHDHRGNHRAADQFRRARGGGGAAGAARPRAAPRRASSTAASAPMSTRRSSPTARSPART